MSKTNPNYYAVIPANVRYDTELTAQAKLLYGEIAALSNQEGFCWASNSYFAKLYDMSPKRISELINTLDVRGYIEIKIDAKGGNVRYLYVADPIPKKTDSYPEKNGDPIPKKTEHNNTSINTKKNIIRGGNEKADRDDVIKIYELYLKQFKLPQNSELPRTELLERAKKRYKLTPGRRKAIQVRLADAGFNMLGAAVIGYAQHIDSEGKYFYRGEGNRGWVADLEKFICRKYEIVEEGANKYELRKQANNSNDPWAG